MASKRTGSKLNERRSSSSFFSQTAAAADSQSVGVIPGRTECQFNIFKCQLIKYFNITF
jgi:hypothetical protein